MNSLACNRVVDSNYPLPPLQAAGKSEEASDLHLIQVTRLPMTGRSLTSIQACAFTLSSGWAALIHNSLAMPRRLSIRLTNHQPIRWQRTRSEEIQKLQAVPAQVWDPSGTPRDGGAPSVGARLSNVPAPWNHRTSPVVLATLRAGGFVVTTVRTRD